MDLGGSLGGGLRGLRGHMNGLHIPHLNPSQMSLDETTRVFGLKKSVYRYPL